MAGIGVGDINHIDVEEKAIFQGHSGSVEVSKDVPTLGLRFCHISTKSCWENVCVNSKIYIANGSIVSLVKKSIFGGKI